MKLRRKMLFLKDSQAKFAKAVESEILRKEEEMMEIINIRLKLDKLGVRYIHNTGIKKLRILLEEAKSLPKKTAPVKKDKK